MQVPIISTTTITISMEDQYITGCFLVRQIVYFGTLTRNLHELSLPCNVISPLGLVNLRTNINYIGYHLLLSLLLTEVNLLLYYIVGLVNFDS